MEVNPVKKFREYLRIKSVHPNPNYASAVTFLNKYGQEIGLKIQNLEVAENHIVVVMTLLGKQPSLKSILLNSHMDVVQVYPEKWKYDAFAAIKEENGDIYGRGTQDMKSVGIQYLEAIRKLKEKGQQFERNIHLSFVPDEETGGTKGMLPFIQSQLFKDLNIGFVLDEGLANPGNKYSVFNAERSLWQIIVKCQDNFDNEEAKNSADKIFPNVAKKTHLEEFKLSRHHTLIEEREKSKLFKTTCLGLGDVTTLNLTKLETNNERGIEFSVAFDIRLALTEDLKKFEEKIKMWCSEAGKDITYTFQCRCDNTEFVTSTDLKNPWWNAFSNACKTFDVELSLEVFSAATDSCYLRMIGLPAIGFSPIRNTPILLHDHNEFLNENIFLEGIEAYCVIIPELANLHIST